MAVVIATMVIMIAIVVELIVIASVAVIISIVSTVRRIWLLTVTVLESVIVSSSID